jgi:flavin reductase (DIM6/NTAB) family NADH-FMN oxidoreductase RutF
MFYDTAINAHGLRHDPFKALIVPRPIGWISSLSPSGALNLAPYSYFNAFGDKPYIVGFSSNGVKDSQLNVEATGEFVCSLAVHALKDQMNTSSAMVGAEVDEFALAGLTPAASKLVKSPRVAESPVALECRYLQSVKMQGLDGAPSDATLVLGQVVGIHIDDGLITDGIVNIAQAKPIARLGYMEYATVDEVFSMSRPVVD